MGKAKYAYRSCGHVPARYDRQTLGSVMGGISRAVPIPMRVSPISCSSSFLCSAAIFALEECVAQKVQRYGVSSTSLAREVCVITREQGLRVFVVTVCLVFSCKIVTDEFHISSPPYVSISSFSRRVSDTYSMYTINSAKCLFPS